MSEHPSIRMREISRISLPLPKNYPLVGRAIILVILLGAAAMTPGFLSAPTFVALIAKVSVIGCLAVAMTFITIGGYIMSFALGATAASSSVMFIYVLNDYGFFPAIVAALLFGASVTAIQGALVGFIRANPIIVTIAANVLIYGSASWLIQNMSAFMQPNLIAEAIRGKVLGISSEFFIFLAAVGVSQILLSFTLFGRQLLLIGSGARAAEAIGVNIGKVTTAAYALSGAFAALSGVLLAIRYGQGNMELAASYDYDAIAAVLVGGTAIQGGFGSQLRTLMGVSIISVIEIALLLNGFREEWRFTITGLLIIMVVILYSKRQKV